MVQPLGVCVICRERLPSVPKSQTTWLEDGWAFPLLNEPP